MREWSIMTTHLEGEGGAVRRLHAKQVEPETGADGRLAFRDVAGGEVVIDAELVVLAMGFTQPVRKGLLEQLEVRLDGRGNVVVDQEHRTTAEGVFAAGDMHRGASLIVWAIREGRDAATGIDRYLRAATPAAVTAA